MKTIAIFRRVGEIPPMDWFGQGCFASGYGPDLIDPDEFTGQGCDIAVVSGGLARYNQTNNRLFHFYRSHNIDTFVIEHGRLVPQRIIREYWIHYLNGVPMLPGLNPTMTHERRRRLELETNFIKRGEAIVVAGQDLLTDRMLGIHIMESLRQFTKRKIIYRPRYTEGVDKHCAELADEVHLDAIDPWKDIAQAWAVITGWSNMGGEALMAGIPVVCEPCASYAEYASSGPLDGIDSWARPSVERIEEYLMRFSYLLWSNEELREGAGFRWMMEHGR